MDDYLFISTLGFLYLEKLWSLTVGEQWLGVDRYIAVLKACYIGCYVFAGVLNNEKLDSGGFFGRTRKIRYNYKRPAYGLF